MNKKEILIPFAFMALSLLFIVVCAMVFLSGGKSKRWIARKMKIGGLLLTLTAFQVNTEAQTKCYDYVEINHMSLTNGQEKAGIFNLKKSTTYFGHVSSLHSKAFSFALLDKKGKIIQKGTILPANGEFKTTSEDFKFELDKNIKPGTYTFLLFAVSLDKQDLKNPNTKIDVTIKNE